MPASFTPSETQPIPVPEALVALCTRYRQAGHSAWLVGGCVRDLLLGREIQDWDLATDALPDQTKGIFRRVIPTGIEHGTVTVRFRGQGYEVTTLRGEGEYSDGRRPDSVTFVRTIEEDLARRDFTVNAIAYDPIDAVLTDPYGGQADLLAKQLRAVGDPTQRFQEDGLRPLRGARFCATLGADLEPATEAAIRPTLDVFRKVSKERVRDEWMKALRGERPSRAFVVMARTGLLGVCCPPLDAAAREPWPSRRPVSGTTVPILDVLLQSLDLARDASMPTTSLLAALFHFLPAPDQGTSDVERWLREYRFSNAERQQVVALLRLAGPLIDGPFFDEAFDAGRAVWSARRWTAAASRDLAAPALMVADVVLHSYERVGRMTPRGDLGVERRKLLVRFLSIVREVLDSGCPLATKELALDGRELMDALSIPPGPIIGRLREELLDRVLEDPNLNTKAGLVQLAKERLRAGP